MFETKEEKIAYSMGLRAGTIKALEEKFGRPKPEDVPDWEALTLGDVAAFSKERHSKLNVDTTLTAFQLDPNTLVWGNNNHRIVVFWVTGGSEGYYVHVETTACKEPKTLMLAKVWDVESAEKIVRDTARFIWDEWRN
jgi:hypothetical protein